MSISFFNVVPVSASTIQIQPSSYYNTNHGSLNDQIQIIINSAKNGDTINFMGKYYGNLSLIINKSLNIISKVNTTVSGDLSGQPVFLVIGSKSKWTNITGLNIKSANDGISIQNTNNVTVSKNSVSSTKGTGIKVSKSTGVKIKNNVVTSSKTGISVSNSKNNNIQNNTVKKSVKSGVEIQKSQDVVVVNNSIVSSGEHGASISGSTNVDLEGNKIESNQKNGVNLINTNNIIVNNNTIRYNTLNGIYFDKNVKNTQITLNNIYHNKCGIELFNSASYTKINRNIIDWNPTGNDVNSKTDHLDMSYNLITNSKEDKGGSSNGVGINIGSGFEKSSTFTVHDNAIYGSGKWEIEAGDSADTGINIGYNWYGSDDPSQVRVCPKVTKNLITWGFVDSNGLYSVVFFEGSDGTQFATGLSGFDVTFQMNKGTKIKETVQNGTASTSISSRDYQLTGNVLTITAVFEQLQEDISDAEAKENVASQNQNNSGNGDNGKGNGDNGNGTGNNGNGGDGPGNNGNGNNNGNSNGNENTPGNTGGSSGQSGSSSKLERNSAMLDGAGEVGKSSSSQNQANNQQSKTAQEILLDNVNNTNLWSIVALVMLIAAIIVVYYRKEIELMYRK